MPKILGWKKVTVLKKLEDVNPCGAPCMMGTNEDTARRENEKGNHCGAPNQLVSNKEAVCETHVLEHGKNCHAYTSDVLRGSTLTQTPKE